MKYRYLLALTLSALLLAGCTKPAPDTSVTETETSVAETTIATAETTTAVTSATEETTVTTAESEADIVMKPIPSGEQFEVMACEITELPVIKTEEDFPDKEALNLAKELCFNNNTKEIAYYNEGIENEDGLPIETAKDIRFSNGVSYDFDNDGKDESVICLHYTPDFYLGGGYCVYVDDEKYEILMSGVGCHIEVSVLEFDSYRFMQLNTYAGAIGYYYDIYSFENGMPEKALDIGDSHAIDYENGFFTCYIKYQFTAFPFAFCSDGKFRQFAIEEITPEDFEAHVTDGKAYLDTLDNLETIYTSGYYAYWFMCGDEERYLSLNGNGVYEESRAYGYIDTQFTDELIYGKDVWSAVPISTTDPAEKIWNFLSTYESPDLPNKYFLFDFNGDDFPEVAFIGWDEDMFHKLSYPYMTVYDLSGNEPVSLGGTSQGLSPYSDDKECIGLYCNEKGEYFYHSLAHYIIKNSDGYSYNFERFIIPVDFDSHIVEFTHDPTEQRNFDNEYDAEKYKERVFKELEPLTLVTELKTSYMVADRDDEEAFREMYSGGWKINYRSVSADNEFIDYKYTKELPSTTDIGDLADKAVQCLMESEHYKDAEHIKEIYDTHKPEKLAPFFDENGTLTPVFSEAYVDDFDNDGKTEAFIVVDMPFYTGDCLIRNYLIFADSSGNTSVIEDYHGINLEAVLDYGEFKHIAFGGYGWIGADMHSNLFGVVDGKVVDFYSLRGEFVKENCFVSTFGHQGIGDFMYYDTVTKEYRTIVGKEIPLDTIKEMDKDNVLADYYTANENGSKITAQLVGGKYYLLMYLMDPGTVYTYENGKFVLQEDSNVRKSWAMPNSVYDIDIDKALAEMKPVE